MRNSGITSLDDSGSHEVLGKLSLLEALTGAGGSASKKAHSMAGHWCWLLGGVPKFSSMWTFFLQDLSSQCGISSK